MLLQCRRETKKKKPPKYRVMLHNDSVNRREYVVKVLLKVVDGYTVGESASYLSTFRFKKEETRRNLA